MFWLDSIDLYNTFEAFWSEYLSVYFEDLTCILESGFTKKTEKKHTGAHKHRRAQAHKHAQGTPER